MKLTKSLIITALTGIFSQPSFAGKLPVQWTELVDVATSDNKNYADVAFSYDISAGSLTSVLNRFSLESGIVLSFSSELTNDIKSTGLNGQFTISDGLHRLLTGTALQAIRQPNGDYLLQRSIVVPPKSISVVTAILPTVVVIGRNAGASNLAEEYSGGQVARGSQLGFLGNIDFLDSPFSTIAYTASYMQNKGAQRLSDVIGLSDPSVEFDRVNSYAEQISIRGFSAAAQDIAYGGLYGVLPSMRIYPEMAERIEVLKGPSTLLSGMMPDDSIGGTVNIVPKRAGNEPQAQVTSTYSSHSHVGGHLDVGQRFGSDKALGIRFNGVYRSGESEVSGQNKQIGLSTVGIDWVGDGVRLSADLIANREHTKGFGYWGFYGDLTNGGVPTPPDPRQLLNAPDSYYRNQDSSGVVRAEVDMKHNWLFYTAIGARSSRFESLANHIDINDLKGNTTDGWYFWKTQSSTQSGLVGLRGKFTTGITAHEINVSMTDYVSKSAEAAAGFFDNPYASNIYHLTYSATPDVLAIKSSTYIPSVRETLKSFGIADTLSLANGKFKLTLGVRKQWVQSEDLQMAERYEASRMSPAFAGVWNLTPLFSFYFNNSTGLVSGGIAPQDATNSGQVLAPIRTKQREIGVKVDYENFATTMSLFQIEKPTADYLPDTKVWGLVGDTRNIGLEITTMGEPVQGTRLLGGIAFNNATYQGDGAGKNAGNRVIGIPRQLIKIGVEYDVVFISGLTVTGGLMHSSKQALRVNNNADAPGWTRWDVGLRYATQIAGRRTTLRADIQNITNKAYWLAPAFNGLGAPRTALLSATVDF